ncbi:uncharacterized protein [Malus domestica]|uniref:uncharacterized protein n=1 Tax=Malus domestica TaxID=3750 RepID=UPI00049931A6
MYKCDVVIQNIRKEELMVMLWADVAEAFSSLSAEEFSLSVIVVFTSLKVKIYLGFVIVKKLWTYFLPLQSNETKLKFCRLLKKLQLMNWLFWIQICIRMIHLCVEHLSSVLTCGSTSGTVLARTA